MLEGRSACSLLQAAAGREAATGVGAASAGEEAEAVSSRGVLLWDGTDVPHSSAACRESRAELSAGHGEQGALAWQEGAAAAWELWLLPVCGRFSREDGGRIRGCDERYERGKRRRAGRERYSKQPLLVSPACTQ